MAHNGLYDFNDPETVGMTRRVSDARNRLVQKCGGEVRDEEYFTGGDLASAVTQSLQEAFACIEALEARIRELESR